MKNLSDVSDSSVTGAGRGKPADTVIDPPVLSMEDQVGPEHPIMRESESGRVVPDVMLESPPQADAEQPNVIVNVVEYPRQDDTGRVSPALSVNSGGSSGRVSSASYVSGRSFVDGMSEELRFKLEMKRMEMEERREREAREAAERREDKKAEREVREKKEAREAEDRRLKLEMEERKEMRRLEVQEKEASRVRDFEQERTRLGVSLPGGGEREERSVEGQMPNHRRIIEHTLKVLGRKLNRDYVCEKCGSAV